jgi:Amt family ammonium transporter
MKWKQCFWALALLVAATGTVTAFAPAAFGQEADAAAAAPETPAPAPEAAPEGEVVVEEVAAEEEAPVTADAVLHDANILWTCLAAFLVFFMQAGFALVECGFTRAKNACNIIMKNVMDFAMGSIIYWLFGFSLMFGAMQIGNYLAWGGEGVAFVWTGQTDDQFNWAFLIFQTVFAATAATIVSGAMAERTKFVGYLIYSVLITAIVYPVFGSWAWNGLFSGGGWLEAPEGGLLAGMNLPAFSDYAGSTVVHSIGGWCALAGAIVLGPRIGKYGKDGKINPIPGHNIPMGALGVFILWMGWFGFNPGSTTAIGGGEFALIAVTTNLSACTGAIGAMVVSWIAFKKPDPSLTLNGVLAGLVGITAGCYTLSPISAAITGLVSGVLVVGAIVFFDKLKIDDPVGAVSVHGVCGAWGTLAAGLFAMEGGLLWGGGFAQTATQLIGIVAAFAWAFPTSMIIFLAIKYTIGLRVTQQEEIEGLDIGEHGMYAYPPHLVADGMTTGVSHGHSSVYTAPVGSPAGAHN